MDWKDLVLVRERWSACELSCAQLVLRPHAIRRPAPGRFMQADPFLAMSPFPMFGLVRLEAMGVSSTLCGDGFFRGREVCSTNAPGGWFWK